MIGVGGKIHLGGGEREYSWWEMIGRSERGYDVEVSGGQIVKGAMAVSGSGKWSTWRGGGYMVRGLEWGGEYKLTRG
jgi:hypothetical protein